jgi:hypothetical protein
VLNGAIKPGDYLTLSATKPGYAMKATQAGPTIGKAIGFFDSGTPGTVLVIVSLSYYDPNDGGSNIQDNSGDFQNLQTGNLDASTIEGTTASFGSLNVSGDTTLSNLTVTGQTHLAFLGVSGDASIGGDLTVGGNLTVTGITNLATLYVNGHILSTGTTPQIALGANGGSTTQVSIDGTDTAGTITVTVPMPATGTTAPTYNAGDLADITFTKQYEYTPRVVISADNADSLAMPVYVTKSTTGYQVMSTAALQPGKTYQFDYVIIGSNGVAAAN